MGFRALNLVKTIKRTCNFNHSLFSTSIALPIEGKTTKVKEYYKTENNFTYLEDPDSFGNLSRKSRTLEEALEDEGDIKEHNFLENLPLHSQKLTIRQYADLIKQYIAHKQIKKAMDVLEVRMLTQDRVKPENYIYNILIGACAEVGYTKKAFKLYNDMKQRALKPTGDTYTCLFEACANSPWTLNGLHNAKHLRTLMIEKGIEPNLTNYNVMIKAFGRCGDLTTAFKIVDEMISKKIKIRVHTLNNLLHACIADKESGLRHALVIWRKMLKLREKPNIYSFNLMLKCVKECNLGAVANIEELFTIIAQETPFAVESNSNFEIVMIENTKDNCPREAESSRQIEDNSAINKTTLEATNQTEENIHVPAVINNAIAEDSLKENISFELVDKLRITPAQREVRKVPNLLSRVIRMKHVLSLQQIHTVQDKFAIVGGQEDFFKEMEVYSVKPDVKTFTQMLAVLEDTREAENKLIETMKNYKIKTDIDFYNMLIKKRCLRSDYDGAFDAKELIKAEQKIRKKKYPLKKKLKLNMNIMTYGVLAMACKTREIAEKLLNEMREEQIKVNIEILGTLLRHGTAHNQFGYVLYIMNVTKEEKVKVNSTFVQHLEAFVDKCENFVKQVDNHGKHRSSEGFRKSYANFLDIYQKWLKENNMEEALQKEHPWQQFRENYPETVQRPAFKIKEPKKFFKRNRKFVPYIAKLN